MPRHGSWPAPAPHRHLPLLLRSSKPPPRWLACCGDQKGSFGNGHWIFLSSQNKMWGQGVGTGQGPRSARRTGGLLAGLLEERREVCTCQAKGHLPRGRGAAGLGGISAPRPRIMGAILVMTPSRAPPHFKGSPERSRHLPRSHSWGGAGPQASSCLVGWNRGGDRGVGAALVGERVSLRGQRQGFWDPLWSGTVILGLWFLGRRPCPPHGGVTSLTCQAGALSTHPPAPSGQRQECARERL